MSFRMLFVLVLLVSPIVVSSAYSANGDYRPASGEKAEVIALCYHSFLGKKFEMDFTPEAFGEQLESVKSLGYRFVSFDDIVSNRVTGKNNVLITIDDGNISLKKVFDRVLMTNGIKPLLFIYPAVTSRLHYSVTWRDLKYYLQQGATIGAHGYYHMFVNEKLFRKNPKAFYKEIYKSKAKLEQKLGVPVSVFGYPFGLYSDITVETLKKAGYSYAFSLNNGVLKVPLADNADPLRLPRYYVTKPSWKGIYRMLKLRVTAKHQAEINAAGKETKGS